MLNSSILIALVFAVSWVPGLYHPDGRVEMMTVSGSSAPTYVFATYAETREQLRGARSLAESVRDFSGQYSRSPIRVYVPDDIEVSMEEIHEMFAAVEADIRVSHTPEKARWFYYAGKTYAAGQAEKDAEGTAAILIWMDDDTIILQEPSLFNLDPSVSFAYRPVMHNRSGSLFEKPPDAFWSRIYDVLSVGDEKLFPMVTPADRQKIRAYFNAGLLVVRPEKGILRKWGQDFTRLIEDTVLVDMCRENVDKRIFLHQTALVGAVLNTLGREELVELPKSYNYPLFFEQMFEASTEFGTIEGITTLRYDVYFRNPDPRWSEKLKGPAEKIAWLKSRLNKKAD
jgi:hypothetical protein